LLEIVFALSSPGGFSRLLNSRKQECDEDCDNRNYHQKFNQGKSTSTHTAPPGTKIKVRTLVTTTETKKQPKPRRTVRTRKSNLRFCDAHFSEKLENKKIQSFF